MKIIFICGLGGDAGVLGINYVLDRGIIGSGEVDLLFALVGDGDTGSTGVAHLAGSNIIDDGGEFNVGEGDSLAHLLGDLVHDVHVHADDLGTLVILKGSEESVGMYKNGVRVTGAGGQSKAGGHQKSQGQNDGNNLFHNGIFLSK